MDGCKPEEKEHTPPVIKRVDCYELSTRLHTLRAHRTVVTVTMIMTRFTLVIQYHERLFLQAALRYRIIWGSFGRHHESTSTCLRCLIAPDAGGGGGGQDDAFKKAQHRFRGRRDTLVPWRFGLRFFKFTVRGDVFSPFFFQAILRCI